MKKTKFPKILHLGLILLFASVFIYLGGCKSETPVTAVSQQGNYNTSLAAFTESSTSDNVLMLSEVKFLLRKIELETEGGGEESEINLGPLVVNLELTARAMEFTYAKVVPGVYNEIHFQLHKPSPNENISDPEFTESTSIRYSVIVKGMFDGEFFVYKTDVTVSKEIEFENHSVAITANGFVNITTRVNPYLWFEGTGGMLNPLDPVNKILIDKNIKDSFRRAFKDNDKNGVPD
jgi:hypothetical protein